MNSSCSIGLSTNFSLNWQLRIFWIKFAHKGSYFQSKTDKIDTTIEFCIFELVIVSNFTLKKQLGVFGQNLSKKDICLKTEKVNVIIEFCIFKLVLEPNFTMNWQLWFFDQICAKRVFLSKIEKVSSTYSLHNSPYSS